MAGAIPDPSFDPLKPWWDDRAEVYVLLAWLVQSGRIYTLEEALQVVEKPKNWAPERESMIREEALERQLDEEEAFESDLRRRGHAA